MRRWWREAVEQYRADGNFRSYVRTMTVYIAIIVGMCSWVATSTRFGTVRVSAGQSFICTPVSK